MGRITKQVMVVVFLLVMVLKSGAETWEVIALEEATTSLGTITDLGLPVAASPGHIVFQGSVDPGPQPSFSAVLHHGSSGLSIIARAGQTLPGGTQDIENLFNAGSTVPSLNTAGDVVFVAEIGPVGQTNFDSGIVRYDRGAGLLMPLVRDGDTVPDGFGHMFISLLNRPAINSLGVVGFYAEIDGATGGFGNGDGIFRQSLGTLACIARTAQPLPGGGTIDDLSWPTLNDSGQIAFYATIGGSGGSAAGIFVGDGASITKIARTGDIPVPGWVIRSFDPVGGVPINNGGWVAFRAQIDATAPFDTVFRGNGSSTVLVAFAGQPVPGSTGTLRSIDRNVAFNNQGQAAFIAGITDNGVKSGIFRGDGTILRTIAREGDLVPGTSAGFFTDFRNKTFAINDSGDVAFVARFRLGCCLQDGLFYFSDSGGLERVVTEADVLAGSTVSSFGFVGTSPSEVREATGIDGAGRVVFRFSLANGLRGIALYGGHRLFRDGFESGNTAAWSVSVP